MGENTWGLKLITPPEGLVVDVADVKLSAKILQDAEDAETERLIRSATRSAENVMERQLLSAVWRLTLDRFPAGRIYLPRPPLRLLIAGTPNIVPSVEYDDAASEATDLDADDFRILADHEPGAIEAVTYWPATRSGGGAVRIEYPCGYGVADDVPVDIRDAIIWLVGWRLDNREATDKIPAAFRTMLAPYHHGETFVGIYDRTVAELLI